VRSLFQHCPACGRAGFAAGEGPALSCAGCGFHYYLNPAVAVGAVIRDGRGHILLIRRAKDPGRGKLALPGGFVDRFETAEAAVRRELREEVGLEVQAARFLISHPNLYVYRGVPYAVLDLYFQVTVASLDVTVDGVEVHGHELCDPASITADALAFAAHHVAITAALADPGRAGAD